MRLVDLEPKWLSPDVFIFKNPTGGNDWLTCKRVPMNNKDQYRLVYGGWTANSVKTEWNGKSVVFTKADFAWQFRGNDFATLTVTPSLDCSSSGNWHGFITNGEIVGGLDKEKVWTL